MKQSDDFQMDILSYQVSTEPFPFFLLFKHARFSVITKDIAHPVEIWPISIYKDTKPAKAITGSEVRDRRQAYHQPN